MKQIRDSGREGGRAKGGNLGEMMQSRCKGQGSAVHPCESGLF